MAWVTFLMHKGVTMKYKKTNEYDEILKDLLTTESELSYITENGISVGIVAGNTKKMKGSATVYADCRKVPEMYRLFAPFDFIITIYEPSCRMFCDEQMRILIFHELLHIGVKNGKMFTRVHDLEDFKLIIDRYGVDWDAN